MIRPGRCGEMSSSWSCTAVAPPAVRIRSATTERLNGSCGRLMQSQPCWRSQVATAAAAIGARCCFSSFTTSFREPRSRRCLTRRNRSGARPGARPARNAIGGWQGCRVRRTQQRCGVGGVCSLWRPGRLWFAFLRDRGQRMPFHCRSKTPLLVVPGCSYRVSTGFVRCRSGVNQA